MTVTVARWVSRLLHPFVIAAATLFGALALTTSPGESARLTLILLATAIVPPLLFILVRVRSGRFSDIDVSLREQRRDIYLFGLACAAVFSLVLHLTGASRATLAGNYGLLAAVVVAGVITARRTKVSVHALIAMYCALVFATIAPVIGAALLAGALLVGWSRVVLAHHTWAQVWLGWGVAATAFVVVQALIQAADGCGGTA